LEAADARKRPRGSANFGGIVGKGGQVIPVKSYGVGELASRDLHAVAGVSAKAENGLFN